MVSASFLLLNPEWQKSTWLSQSVDTEHCPVDFYSYQCSGRRNGEMCGDEQKRVDGSIKMKLRMPTTQFAHLLICLFAYLLIWLGQQQHKYVFRYLKWPLLLEEVIWECQQQTEQTKWLGRAWRIGMCVMRLLLAFSSVVPSCWVFHAHHKDVHIASLSQSSYDYRWILTTQLNPSSLFQHENSTPSLNTAFNTKKPSNLLYTSTAPKVRTNSNQYAPLWNLSSFLVRPYLTPPMHLTHFHIK